MGMKPAEQCHNWGAECHHLSAWPHLPHGQSRATHGDILFRKIQALWGPRLLCAKSQPTAYLAAKLESTQMTELIIKPSTEPELIPSGCYWAFALSLFYGTLVKRMYIITQLRTHTFPAQGALCLLPSPKSLACRCSSPAAAASLLLAVPSQVLGSGRRVQEERAVLLPSCLHVQFIPSASSPHNTSQNRQRSMRGVL